MRMRGYRRALAEFGVTFDPSLIFSQEITIEEGRKLGRRLSEHRDITGIFASADLLAAGIMAGLHEKGVRIPQEKSVVGFDDNYLAQLTEPGLTTVHQDADQKGIWAMNMILSQLRGEEMEQKEVILPVNLTERGSVCRISL